MDERSLRPSCLVAARLTRWSVEAGATTIKPQKPKDPTVRLSRLFLDCFFLLPTAKKVKPVLVWMQLSARIRYPHVSMFQTPGKTSLHLIKL